MKSIEVFKRVFSDWKQIVLLLFVALVFYLLNGFIYNIPNIKSFYSLFGFFGTLEILTQLSFRFAESLTLFSAITTIFLSVLIGILICLLVYRFELVKTAEVGKLGFFGSMGIFLGLAAPGCAACGVGLLSLLGFSSALSVLPFNGKEANIIAIIFVTISIWVMTGKLYNPVCQVNFMKKTQKKKMKGGSK